MLWLANLITDLIHKCDNCLVDIVALVDCLNHLILRNLIGSCFNHDDLFLCRGNCEL